jgi:hypothetical protein
MVTGILLRHIGYKLNGERVWVEDPPDLSCRLQTTLSEASSS